MSLRNTLLAVALILLITFLASAVAAPLLPDSVASHWDQNGMVNGYMPKLPFLLMMPIILLVSSISLLFLPMIDPLKANFQSVRSSYHIFIVGFTLVMAYIHALTLVYNLGYTFNFTTLMMPAFSILMLITGFMVERAKPNWFVGIRTPWTMSSPTVWEKTHRLGGLLFKILAAIILMGLFLPGGVATFLFLISITTVSVGLIVYSYVVYKQEQDRKLL